MSSKMLIDASHPEETRVVVTKGNKIEDFDFESEHKKQIRGNIYLAKVTRVEPSLQAAFVEYGGNRHGFLPFSEIHPDYYQIPVADREALMREMAEELAAEEAEDEPAEAKRLDGEDEGKDEGKGKRRSRRGGRRRKAASASGEEADGADDALEGDASDGGDASEDGDEPDAFADEDGDTVGAAVESESVSDEPSDGNEGGEDKPKRRSTRRRKAPVAADAGSTTTDAASEATPGTSDDEAPEPKRRTSRRKKAEPAAEDAAAADASGQDALVQDASVQDASVSAASSEAAPAEQDTAEQATADQATADDAAAETPKPKRRSSRRKKAVEPTADAPAPAETVTDSTAADLALNEAEGDDAPTGEAGTMVAGDEADEKPAKRTRSRRGRGKRTKAEEASDDATESDADGTATEAAVAADDRPAEEGSTDDGPDDEDAPEETGADDALDEAPRRKASPRKHYKIQEVIKRRQILLVQVTKEERGNKGAALTTYLSLAGRYSVLMPNTARGGGISRKIAQASDRKRLKEIAKGLEVPDGMGVILRTAAAARTKAEVNRDFEYLMRLWDSVRELTLQSTAPALVYEEGDLIKRAIRDLYNKEMGDIVVAGEQGYREAKDFMRMLMPSQAKSVKRWDKPTQLLAAHGVEAELERMMQPQVNLKSGGYIIINQTEALVAIDVNSGRSTREHSVEQTARNTNLEAAEEIARQLRLRDLAGLIVIDFIDMDERRNNRAVESRLKDCLKTDRARIQLGRISSFGLLEMSRQRMRSSVLESTMRECPHCHGTGYLKSDSSIALAILRAIDEQMRKNPDHAVVVRTDAATALNVLNAKRAQLAALEAEHGLPIMLEADATLAHGDVKVERGAFVERRERIERQVRQDRSLMDVVDADTDDDEDEAEVEAAQDDGEDDDRGEGKRRRRGRRGGRNRRADSQDEVEAADTPEPDELASPADIVVEAVEDGPTDGVTTADAPDEADDDGETKPRRRRSTRRKAPVDGAEEQRVEAASERSASTDAGSTETSEEGTSPKARSTRRRKAPVASTGAADDRAETTASTDAEAQHDMPSEADGVGEETDESPRRSTRRRKAPVAAPTASAPMAAAVTSAEADAADEVAAEPPADEADGAAVSTRRRTRRVTRRAPGLAGPDSGSGADAAPALEPATANGGDAVRTPASEEPSDAPATTNGDATTAPEPEAASADESADQDGKPRRGWWNRGFF